MKLMSRYDMEFKIHQLQFKMSSEAQSKKPRQIRELKEKLNDVDIEAKQEAIRGIISYMTNGKDVSSLFMDVLKNITTPSLQLKKLIYLYVMSYAKVHPDLAILGVNTFRKDAVDKSNPFLRALAVRTMGCIRIKDITEYLCDPLKKALKDQDPYVRKTGALCVPKLYEIAPQLIEDEGFLKLLQNLLNDGNATVVSNALVSISICSQLKGEPLLKLTETLVQKLLTAMNDCNQWGVVYILDTLTAYLPKDPQQAENIMERVSSRLAHTNSAVALSSIRLIIKYMDYLSNAEMIRTYNNKISAPLITMISRQNEISYLVLKTINLVLQKRPLLLPKQLKIFFVNYHDPLYVKLQKLQVLSKIANNENILMILHELKEYIHEVDVEFVRKTVNTMGKCAIKLQKMADKCVQCLWETLKTKIPYVVQEAVIVIRDIFRKYPNKYQGLLADICENLNNLDDPEAKASIVWIIGEYIEIIDNADELMANFVENFKDEPDVVQQQILISCMKLYLLKPEDGQQILKDLFKYVTKECQNPDLRDRGFIYWRLLSTSPQMAKKIVLSTRPLISDQSYSLETQFLQKLIENIGFLSSVYSKKPEDFVKRLKQNANAREVVEEDAEQLLAKNQHEQKVQFFEQQPVSFANKNEQLVDNTPTDLINLQVNNQPQQQSPPKIQIAEPPRDLLDVNTTQETQAPSIIQKRAPTKPEASLLDLEAEAPQSKLYQTMSLNQGITTAENSFATSIQGSQANQGSILFGYNQPIKIVKNIVIPFVQVINEAQFSRERKYTGMSVKAAFQRQEEKVFLQFQFKNTGTQALTDFALKMNSNAFKLGYGNVVIPDLALNPGQSRQVKLELNYQNGLTQLTSFPYLIDCALKVSEDVYVFKIPCSLSIGMLPNFSIGLEEYKQIVSDSENERRQEVLANKLELNDFANKLKDNNLFEVMRRQNGPNEMMANVCVLTSGVKLVAEIIFDKANNGVSMRLTGPNDTYISYFHHALSMIVNL